MPRVKRSVHARKKRRKVLGQAKGYWGSRAGATATPRSRSTTRSSTPIATARTRSGRSVSSGSCGSTRLPARTGSRTTSSSPACTRRASSSTGRCSPTWPSPTGRVHRRRRAGEGRARRQGGLAGARGGASAESLRAAPLAPMPASSVAHGLPARGLAVLASERASHPRRRATLRHPRP